jgi:hypothetical protein
VSLTSWSSMKDRRQQGSHSTCFWAKFSAGIFDALLPISWSMPWQFKAVFPWVGVSWLLVLLSCRSG